MEIPVGINFRDYIRQLGYHIISKLMHPVIKFLWTSFACERIQEIGEYWGNFSNFWSVVTGCQYFVECIYCHFCHVLILTLVTFYFVSVTNIFGQLAIKSLDWHVWSKICDALPPFESKFELFWNFLLIFAIFLVIASFFPFFTELATWLLKLLHQTSLR